MHEYYFKIKKGDLEFEFSTTDKFTFEEKLSDWINGIVHGAYIEPPQHDNAQEPVQRSGFIDVKNLSSINDLTTPVFDSAQKANIVEEVNFERALEESMQNPKTEVVEKVDTASDFEGYLHSYNPQNSIDNLVVTALYILNIENKERFLLIKDIYLKNCNNLGIDHLLQFFCYDSQALMNYFYNMKMN